MYYLQLKIVSERLSDFPKVTQVVVVKLRFKPTLSPYTALTLTGFPFHPRVMTQTLWGVTCQLLEGQSRSAHPIPSGKSYRQLSFLINPLYSSSLKHKTFMCVHAKLRRSCPTLCDPNRLFCPWDSPGMNTGVGCHALLQGIFLTQGSNPRLLYLLHWQVGSLPLVPPGDPQTHIVLEKWDLKHPFFLHSPLFTCFPTGSSCLQTSHAVYLPLNKP